MVGHGHSNLGPRGVASRLPSLDSFQFGFGVAFGTVSTPFGKADRLKLQSCGDGSEAKRPAKSARRREQQLWVSEYVNIQRNRRLCKILFRVIGAVHCDVWGYQRAPIARAVITAGQPQSTVGEPRK